MWQPQPCPASLHSLELWVQLHTARHLHSGRQSGCIRCSRLDWSVVGLIRWARCGFKVCFSSKGEDLHTRTAIIWLIKYCSSVSVTVSLIHITYGQCQHHYKGMYSGAWHASELASDCYLKTSMIETPCTVTYQRYQKSWSRHNSSFRQDLMHELLRLLGVNIICFPSCHPRASTQTTLYA